MAQSEETIYLAEQRRFRRLEVSLPVWIATEDDFNATGRTPWSLGYTRDISMGGSKIIVPDGEEEKWNALAARDAGCLLRFDAPGAQRGEYISAHIRHAAREADSDRFWLGIEYQDGARDEKAAAMRAGLHTVKARRRWQGIAALACLALLLGGAFVMKLRGDVAQQRALVAQKESARKRISFQISQLSRGTLASTRAQGIDEAFARQDAEKLMKRLNGDIARLNNPNNQAQIERERAAKSAAQGLTTAGAAGVSNVNLGIALPYGYAWPQVTDDLEQLLGRSVPTVVIFRDWKSEFPSGDARDARVRAKTLQITWEPWQFSNPKAFSLASIAAGKHDKYIDRFARSARSFGGEVWLRFAHEFNGNWYPWSVAASGKNPANYIKAYRHVHDRFTRAGAFNVRWIWCMNAESVPAASWNDPLRAYPGDSYVDMISIDGYNFGTSLSHSRWQSFEDIFAPLYNRAAAKFPRKPLMIGEVGCATVGGPSGGESDKADWIFAMDNALRKRFPRVSGVVWFEAQKEADWRMASSVASLQASRRVWNAPYYRRGEN